MNVKVIISVKKVYIWSSSTRTCEHSKYLKRVTDTSVTECNEIVTVMNNLSIKKINAITTTNNK